MSGHDLIGELAAAYLKPAWARIDARDTVAELGGEYAYFGYGDLVPGSPAGEGFPFLVGLPRELPSDLTMLETPNGKRAHVRVVPGEAGWDLVFVDVTEQWRQQQVVQQKANELHILAGEQRKLMHSLEQARDALRRSRDAAEHASRLKSQFIAKMSHEFRTPLTSILGRSGRLAAGLAADAESAGSVAAIERGATHLLNLVENLLDQAQFDAGDVLITRRAVAVADLLAELAELFVPLAEEKGLVLEARQPASLPPRVEVDDLRLRQILINLLGNACKYTEAGSVRLDATWQAGTLEICVADSGPGISKENQSKIFGAFWRGPQQRERGAGLGLAISRQLVGAMGGELVLDSEPGRGTRVSVRLPAPIAKTTRATGAGASHARVLIAEDDPDVTEMYAMVLGDAGFEVTSVDGGIAAVECVESSDVNLILMDRNLRDIDGFEATRRIRVAGCVTPIVMLTASNLVADRDRALASGCDDFVVKSADMAQLLDVMIGLLDAHA